MIEVLAALAEDKILVTLALVFTCICFGWIIRDEHDDDEDPDYPNPNSKKSWKSLGLLLLIFILLLALAD